MAHCFNHLAAHHSIKSPMAKPADNMSVITEEEADLVAQAGSFNARLRLLQLL